MFFHEGVNAMPPRKSHLKAVAEGSTPPAPPKKRSALTVTKAASDGSHLDLLEAMRDRVAKSVEDVNTPARDLAALTRRLMEITREIEAIHAAAKQEAEENADADDEAFDAEAL